MSQDVKCLLTELLRYDGFLSQTCMRHLLDVMPRHKKQDALEPEKILNVRMSARKGSRPQKAEHFPSPLQQTDCVLTLAG